jgi:hypothetical protein
MARLILVFTMMGLLGIGIAFGLSALAGLINTAFRFPVFLVVLAWWFWTGWKYAKARDRGEF